MIKKIFKDSFYKDLIITFIGQIVVMTISFILNKIISNQYSVIDFGTYNLIRRTASVVTFIMLMAMGIAIPKYISESNEKKDNELTEKYMISSLIIIISAFLLIFLFMFIFKNWISILIFGDNVGVKFIIPLCLFSLGTCLITYAYSYYRGVGKFIEYNMINIIFNIGLIIISLLICNNLKNLYIVWSLWLILYALYEIYKLFKYNKFTFRNFKGKLTQVKELLIYTVPRVPGEFILFAYTLVPLTIISRKFGLEEVAYFSAALSICSLVTPMFSLVGTILLPFVSKSVINKNEGEIDRKINILAILYFIISITIICFVYLLGEYLLVILYNSDYVKSFDLVKIMILSIIPNAYYLLLRNPLDGISKKPYNTISLLISFIVYTLLLCLCKTITNCAYTVIIGYSVLGILSLIFWNIAKKSYKSN